MKITDLISAPSRTSRVILAALQDKTVYHGGTIPAKEKSRRRAASKVARASRRANRER